VLSLYKGPSSFHAWHAASPNDGAPVPVRGPQRRAPTSFSFSMYAAPQLLVLLAALLRSGVSCYARWEMLRMSRRCPGTKRTSHSHSWQCRSPSSTKACRALQRRRHGPAATPFRVRGCPSTTPPLHCTSARQRLLKRALVQRRSPASTSPEPSRSIP
jgi:hypothetical protein